jgi:hypothetical protein
VVVAVVAADVDVVRGVEAVVVTPARIVIRRRVKCE